MMTTKKTAQRIKNYTSELTVEESLGLIRASLSQHQARRIIYENDETGAIVALSFEIAVQGHRFTFRLPARFAGVREQVARAWESRGRAIRDEALLDEQTQRTAWANLKDWVLAQMALIDSSNGAIATEEVFFPYLLDGGRTAFEAFKEQLALPAPKQPINGRVAVEEVRHG